MKNILKRTEKYTRTNIPYLLKNGGWVLSGGAIGALLSLILAIALGNLVPKEIFGNYKFILSITAIVSAFTLPGMRASIIQAVAQGFDGTFKKSIATKIYWGTLSSLSLFGISIYYLVNENTTLSLAFFIAGICIPFMEGFGDYVALLYGKEKFNTATLYQLGAHALVVAGLVTIAFLYPTIISLTLIYFILWTFVRGIALQKSIKYVENDTIKEDSLRYGKHLSAMSVLINIATHIDKILLFHFLGAVELAIYAFALAIPEQIKTLVKKLQFVAFPKFTRSPIAEIKQTLPRKLTFFILGLIIIIALYILAAPYVYTYLLPQYIDSIRFSQIVSLSLISVLTIIPVTALKAHTHVTRLYWYNTLTSIFSISILLFAVITHGLMGAIVARVIIAFVETILSFIFIYTKEI